MTRNEKLHVAAHGFVLAYDPYELADQGEDEQALFDETARLLEEDPRALLEYMTER